MNNMITTGGAVEIPSEFKINESLRSQAEDKNSDSSSTPSIVSIGDSSIDDGESSSSSEHIQEVQQMQSGQQHRVRFSVVRTRSYNVVDELSMDDEPDIPPRRSLGWQYTEREIDLETHLSDVEKERKEKYNRLIIEHMVRAEKLKAEQERIEEMKQKGWKVKAKRMLKSFGRGLIEATSRASFAVGTTPYG
jgi:hypothetical protein